MLRQSELVDLSLSTSLHPGLQQRQQQQHPGWLTAHRQLPPAAAQAVERAASALNESYYYHGRPGSSTAGLDSMCGGAGAGGDDGAAAAAAAGVGLGIRRRAGPQWSPAHTQPQQDQQARYRLLPAHSSQPAGVFAWQGPSVLGQWLNSTVPQPWAAAATRAATGVGHCLGAAFVGTAHRSHSSNTSVGGRDSCAGRPGASTLTPAGPGLGGLAAAASVGLPGAAAAGAAGAAGDASASSNIDDAVLVEKTSDMPQSLQEQEDEAFRGLLFLGGRDSHGRPVVVVNTDAIPAGSNPGPRDAALDYLLRRLMPTVTRGPVVARGGWGPYVLVMVALNRGSQFRLLPGVWCLRVYQSLPRAFRKNVKHVLLLQPSLMVRTGLALLYPFISSKAHAKVKQVHCLLDIDAATAGEVQVPHLGERFLTTLQQLEASRAAPTTSAVVTHLPAAAAGTPHSHLEAATIRPRR
eukprot:gene11678-11821_t